jgi:S1-C subfamily serine protease
MRNSKFLAVVVFCSLAISSAGHAAEQAFLGVMLGGPPGKVVVEDVAPGLTAASLGVQRGDEIVAINGKAVEPGNARSAMEGVNAGDAITITVRRDGAELVLKGIAMAKSK